MALPQRSASTETSTATTALGPEIHLLPKPGRPSLYNPERTAAICALIEIEGISDSAAGALAGVTASTLARWKLEHDGFALVLEMARARFELAQVRAIREARKRDGTPDWRARAWLLKHSSPEGYAPVSRMRKVKTEACTRTRERVKSAQTFPKLRAPRVRGMKGMAAGHRNKAPAPRRRLRKTVQSFPKLRAALLWRRSRRGRASPVASGGRKSAGWPRRNVSTLESLPSPNVQVSHAQAS